MKKFFISICLFLIFCFNGYTQTTPGARLENISLSDFIKFISAKTKISILYSKRIIPRNANITLYSPSILSNKDLLKIFYAVLKENRITSVKEGNTIFLINTSSIRNIGSKYTSNINSPQDTFSTTVIRLKNINVRKLLNTIRHIMSPFGSLDIIESINTIIITDTKSRIKQIYSLLKTLDSSDKIITKLIPIKNASSSQIATELNKLFNDLRVKNDLPYRPIILSEDSSNALLIAARREDFKFIEPIMRSIIKKCSKERFEKVFYIKNAVAKDVYGVILKLLSKTPSFRTSSISYDEATNSILFIGNPISYKKVEELIGKLDVPRKEVYIESLIIETSLSKLSEFGVEWSGAAGKGNTIGFAGSFNAGKLGEVEKSIVGDQQFAPLPNGFNLGVLGNVITYNGVKFATLGGLLNALKTKGDINIVSNPKIVTLDNQKATIFVGENRPYLTSQKYDSNGNPIYTYDYKDVGVKLSILPHINGNKIIMDTSLEVKKVVQNVMVGNTMAPVTLTRDTSTKISMENGEKILISGLIENDSESSQKGVPVLSKIPIMGNLFKYKKTSNSKTNLLIFLSVRVVNNKLDMKNIVKNATQKKSNAIKSK